LKVRADSFVVLDDQDVSVAPHTLERRAPRAGKRTTVCTRSRFTAPLPDKARRFARPCVRSRHSKPRLDSEGM
jgi:hypothetical protein